MCIYACDSQASQLTVSYHLSQHNCRGLMKVRPWRHLSLVSSEEALVDLEKHSVTETLLNQGILVSYSFPLYSHCSLFLAVDLGSHPKQTALQRTCLKENRSHVWDEETKLAGSCFFSPCHWYLTTFFFISPAAQLSRSNIWSGIPLFLA